MGSCDTYARVSQITPKSHDKAAHFFIIIAYWGLNFAAGEGGSRNFPIWLKIMLVDFDPNVTKLGKLVALSCDVGVPLKCHRMSFI